MNTVPPAMELPRFRQDDSWAGTLAREMALAMLLVSILWLMESLNPIVERRPSLPDLWRAFVFGFRFTVVCQVIAVAAVFALRPLLPVHGRRRWLALVPTVLMACLLGWQAQAQWRAFAWPHLAPPDPFDSHAMQHQLVVTTALIAGLHELLRLSRRAASDLHSAQLRQIATEGELAAGRLQVLQAQIEPHFLFNSLANLRRLMRVDEDSGQAMLDDLLQYLEVALPHMRDEHSTLGRDAELVRAFLAVHQVRMGARLATKIDIPGELVSRRVPPMMLLTLVENALKHGLGPLPEGGRIRVSAEIQDDKLVLSVADTGRGLIAGTGGGTGLANIRARLKASYGAAAALTLSLNEPKGVLASIVLPNGVQ